MIILAHIKSPNPLHQIRSFDVPLMLFVSGLVSSRKQITNYGSYIFKRSKRLIVPVWIFLTGYFLIYYGSRYILLGKTDIPYHTVLESYLFLDGIGYVWVIRIFLIIMLVTPILVALEKNVRSTHNYMLLICVLFIVQTGIVEAGRHLPNGFISILYNQYLTYVVGYSIPFLFGLRFKNLEEYTIRNCAIIITCSVLTVCQYLYYHGAVLVNFHDYKFPPYSYFVVYGSFISLILWYFINISNSMRCNLGNWIGRNTIWIYLWHIPFVMLTLGISSWIIRYIVVYLCSAIVFGIQYTVVRKMNKEFINRYFIG